MTSKLSFITAAFLFAGTALMASGSGDSGTAYLKDGVFTYEMFEHSVDHVDLENCPAEFDAETAFCRMTLAAEAANVFVFSFAGDQPLVAVKSYELDDDFLPF